MKELNIFKITVEKKRGKNPDIYYFPFSCKEFDDTWFKFIDEDLCNGKCKRLNVECMLNIKDFSMCNNMTFYEFTKWYGKIYKKVQKLLNIKELLARGELETLTEYVTGDLDELIDIIVKGEYHFYVDTLLIYFVNSIYHKEIDFDVEEYGDKYKPDIFIEEGYIENFEKNCVIKFSDKKFIADKYKQRQQEIKQNNVN